MSKRWHIQGYDGGNPVFECWASGRLSARQIQQLLARLHCQHLTDTEIVSATEASKDSDRVDFMVHSSFKGSEGFMTLGNPHYTAVYKDFEV